MTALTDDLHSSGYEQKAEPRAANFLRRAAWFAGPALIGWGLIGLSIDQTLYEFDTTCIWVGFLALPPVMDLIRRAIPIDARAHAAGGAFCLAACFGWALLAPAERTAAHFTALQQRAGVVAPSWAQLPDTATAEAAQAQDDATAAKQSFLERLAAQSAVLKGGVHPASFIGRRDTVMEGARALATWRALAAQAQTMALSDEEAVQVNAFKSMLAVEDAELGPALRQSYAVSLRDRLEEYGVTAHVLGASGQTIRFDGAALSDPSVQTKLRALLGKDMAMLGYKSIEFSADAGETHAASDAPQDSAKL
ncbi:MAG TPA: hypothetical protein VG735_12435 [Caulobacterales bacterium]|nr:hypothetical protein [Caulobacterales bacterium]